MSEGIDVSKWQGTVDWAKVAGTGKAFAVARATIAKFTKDEKFAANYKGIVDNGLIPGAYHLVSGQSTGAEQAANLKNSLDLVGFDKGLIVLDVEGWSETTNNIAGTLAATEYLANWIKTTYKRTPVIYTGVFWRENLKQHPNNFGSELWLSYYGTNDPNLYVPAAWDNFRIWQYSSTGTVAGITGDVDLNRSVGTLRTLKSLAGWEWDELATQAEFRAVVVDELNKAVTALQAAGVGNTNTVVAELRKVEANLAVDIAATEHDAVLGRDETLAKFGEVLDALSALPVDEDYSDSFVQLRNLINTLHTHLCNRVDLHV